MFFKMNNNPELDIYSINWKKKKTRQPWEGK